MTIRFTKRLGFGVFWDPESRTLFILPGIALVFGHRCAWCGGPAQLKMADGRHVCCEDHYLKALTR